MVLTKRQGKKFMKAGVGLAGAGIGLAVGSSVAEGIGGETGGMRALSASLPAVGTLAGAGLALSTVKEFGKKTKKSMKRRRKR